MGNENDLKLENAGATQSGVTQFLTFRLNNETYGVNLLQVKELIDYGNITEVPMMPNFIAGVINLRGSVVPVVNTAFRFDEQPAELTKRSSIIIVEIFDDLDRMEIGITVDAVNEVLDIPVINIEPAPSFGTKIRTDFIQGMGKVGDELLVILNVEQVLSISELSVAAQSSRSIG